MQFFVGVVASSLGDFFKGGKQHLTKTGHYHAENLEAILCLHNQASDRCKTASQDSFFSHFNENGYYLIADSLLLDKLLISREQGLLRDNFLSRNNEISDAEFIYRAYLKLGKECVNCFRGAFSFAIFDSNLGQLFLARDPMGQRPLYFIRQSKSLVFGSRVKPLLESANLPTVLNKSALASLASRGFSADKKATFYQGVSSIEPGQTLSYRDNHVTLEQYWLPTIREPKGVTSDDDAFAELRTVVSNAVGSHLESGFTTGALLSGGLDSSAVVGFASESRQGNSSNLIAFSTVHPKNQTSTLNQGVFSDDSFYLAAVVESTSIELNTIDVSKVGPFSYFSDAIEFAEMPLIVSTHYSYRELGIQAHKQGCRVVLDGAFGEMGLSNHASAYFRQLLLGGNWLKLYRDIKARANVLNHSFASLAFNQLIRPLITQPSTISPLYAQILQPTFITENQLESPSKTKTEVHWNCQKEKLEAINDGRKPSSQFGSLGERTDVRRVFPFLDTKVLECGLSLPMSTAVRQGYNRYPIRAITSHIIPDKVRWRTSKAPFSPLHKLLFDRQLCIARSLLNDIELHDPINKVVNIELLKSRVNSADEKASESRDLICYGVYLITFLRQFDEYQTAHH